MTFFIAPVELSNFDHPASVVCLPVKLFLFWAFS